LFNTSVNDINLVGKFLVTPIGPKFKTAVLELVNVGILQLVLEYDFRVADVFTRVLEVALLQFSQVAFTGNR